MCTVKPIQDNFETKINTDNPVPYHRLCVTFYYQHLCLDQEIPLLFIAQKLGLVEAPELLLSDKEWKKIKEKSNARQDSSQPCVICKEDFGLQQQVHVTTCSHHHIEHQEILYQTTFWLGFWLDNESSFRSFYVLIYCLKERVSIVHKTKVRNNLFLVEITCNSR